MPDTPLDKHKKLLKQIREHQANFFQFVNRRQNTITTLLEVAKYLDKSKWRVRISKISGSVGGIVSAGLTIAGLATLPIFGVGLALTAAGGVVGVLAGITTTGAAIGDAIVGKKRRRQCNEVLEADERASLEYQNAQDKLRLFVNSIRGMAPIGNVVTATIQFVRLADVLLDATGAGVRGAGAAMDAVPIVGAVFNLITLPVDIGTLISNSIDIHKSTPHQISVKITEVAQKLQDELKELHLKHDDEKKELESNISIEVAQQLQGELKELQLKHDEENELTNNIYFEVAQQLEDKLKEQQLKREKEKGVIENNLAKKNRILIVIVIVVLAIMNVLLFIFVSQGSDGPPLLTYDLPMLSFN